MRSVGAGRAPEHLGDILANFRTLTSARVIPRRFQIGSCKGPTNFQDGETVFHPDDVPASKKASKAFVAKWKRGGVSAGEKPLWNGSSATDQPRFRRTRVNSDHDRTGRYAYNFRAEELPPKSMEPIPKPHKFKVDVMPESRKAEIRAARVAEPVLYAGKTTNLEMPVHRKLAGKAAWNNSNFTSDKERLSRAARLTLKARHNSEKAGGLLEDYTKPSKLPLRTLPEEYRMPGTWVVEKPLCGRAELLYGSADYPRRGRGAAATFVRGTPPRNGRGAAATFIRGTPPRNGRGVAATFVRGTPSTKWPRRRPSSEELPPRNTLAGTRRRCPRTTGSRRGRRSNSGRSSTRASSSSTARRASGCGPTPGPSCASRRATS